MISKAHFLVVFLLILSSAACEEYSPLERTNNYDVFGDSFSGIETKEFSVEQNWLGNTINLTIHFPDGKINNLKIADSLGRTIRALTVSPSETRWDLALTLDEVPIIPAPLTISSGIDIPTGTFEFAKSSIMLEAPEFDLNQLEISIQPEVGLSDEGVVHLAFDYRYSRSNSFLAQFEYEISVERSDDGLILDDIIDWSDSQSLWPMSVFTSPAIIDIHMKLDPNNFRNVSVADFQVQTMESISLHIRNNWGDFDGQIGPDIGGTTIAYNKNDPFGNWHFYLDTNRKMPMGSKAELWASSTLDGEYVKVRQQSFPFLGWASFDQGLGMVVFALTLNHRDGIISSEVIDGNKRNFFFKIRTVHEDWSSEFTSPKLMTVTEESDRWIVEVQVN